MSADLNATWTRLARATLDGAESDSMTFPEGVELLMRAGFDGYAVDFRAGTRTYFCPDGTTITLPTHPTSAVAGRFDAGTVRAAIREAQVMAPGYTYAGFCRKVADAGCAGYFVSIPGRRVLYIGRDGETHTELFPK